MFAKLQVLSREINETLVSSLFRTTATHSYGLAYQTREWIHTVTHDGDRVKMAPLVTKIDPNLGVQFSAQHTVKSG